MKLPEVKTHQELIDVIPVIRRMLEELVFEHGTAEQLVKDIPGYCSARTLRAFLKDRRPIYHSLRSLYQFAKDFGHE